MPAETVEELTLLDKLRRKQDDAVNALAALVDARGEDRDAFEARAASTDDKPSEEEQRTYAAAEEAFNVDFRAKRKDVTALSDRIAEQEIVEQRRQAAARASTGSGLTGVLREPMTYRRDNAAIRGDEGNPKRYSYFRDLAAVQLRQVNDHLGDPGEARKRLEAHALEMRGYMDARQAELDERANGDVERAEREFHGSFHGGHKRGLEESPFERRGATTDDTSMGYLMPPVWLIEDTIELLRAGRVAADLARKITLPAGTDTIRIPRVTTGTLVAPQTEAGPVAGQDMALDYIEASAKTVAGQNDVSMQLLDLSPGQIIDQIIMNDLAADYDLKMDRYVLRGVGGSEIKGIWPAASWGAGTVATATAAANSPQAFFQTQTAMACKLNTGRRSTTNAHFLMNSRRWYWWAGGVDGASGTSGRPLISTGMASTDPAGTLTGSPVEGKVGTAVFGPHDYYISQNVPTTDNGSGVLSGTYDPVILCKWDDVWLFEDSLRMRVLDSPLSGTLQVRFQLYNYVAQIVRYGASIVIAQGAGLAAPTGSIDTAMVYGA